MTKFKQLTKKEKVEHIWEYYRFHIIGTIVGVFFMVNLLVTIFGPKPPEPAANLVIVGGYVGNEEKVDKFKSDIANIIDEGENGTVDLNILSVNWEEHSELTMAMEQKFMIMFQTKELDVLILEREKFDTYVKNLESTLYQPLETIPELAEILAANEDNLVRCKFLDDETEKVYGLFVKDNIKLKEIGLRDDFIITIPIVTEKRDNAVEVIRWLYE